MTVEPKEIRWRVVVGLKQPNRKIRMSGTISDIEAGQVKQMMEGGSSWSTLSGPVGGDNHIVIPASNVAYVELIRA